jgi:hypothetical protein
MGAVSTQGRQGGCMHSNTPAPHWHRARGRHGASSRCMCTASGLARGQTPGCVIAAAGVDAYGTCLTWIQMMLNSLWTL